MSVGESPKLDDDPVGGAWRSAQGLLWVSRPTVEPGWWSTVHAQFAASGLWPLLLRGLYAEPPLRPWETDELNPRLIRTRPGDHDPAALLREWFEGQVPEEEDEFDFATFPAEWPGLTPAPAGGVDPEQRAAEVAELLAGSERMTGARLGLVRCERSADIPALIGWTGPVNHENDTAKFCTVLRSWEERFGVRLLSLGFDKMILSVAAPPADLPAAQLLAAEHLAFCSDTVGGITEVREYATELVGQTEWEFWWD
ncbi:hypothetical protein GCM10010168_55380 [Actinoplanes ianthinogenes]|uniref:DUF4253 domain-containing protein n=1 Tax=Actinoplanes ianthinogenes TaxID=122358 RepID=A0ABN6C9U3_9ACTN|nr:DUF4253 domain-containing protein [Actinoplanes ianthinogenes]BCJ41463.1 hypothetical protein Aiant_21200 [Actinoplanes ianthinogenes]GGR29927.1 hypothetical protein GCM10010168_55380 [Actinoplanes ianthinogenes]